MAAMEILSPTAVPEKEPEAAPGLPDVAAGLLHSLERKPLPALTFQ